MTPTPFPSRPAYYYNSTTTTTDTKTDGTKGSPKTFDAGIALYVGMALTSAAGVALWAKARGLTPFSAVFLPRAV